MANQELDVNSDSSTENNIPKARLDKEIERRKSLETELEALKSKTADEVKKEEKKIDPSSVEGLTEIAKQALRQELQETRQRESAAERDRNDKAFLANLNDELPTIEEDDLKEFANQRGITSLEDAYKIKFENDILDFQSKQKIQNNRGLLSEKSSSSTPNATSDKISSAKTKKELLEAVREGGLR